MFEAVVRGLINTDFWILMFHLTLLAILFSWCWSCFTLWMEGKRKIRWLFLSGLITVSYVVFLGRACFVACGQIRTYQNQIEQALVEKDVVLKENASGDLLADIVIQEVDSLGEVQFDVHTIIGGQDQAYVTGTLADGQIKQLQYQEVTGGCYSQMIQTLKKNKLSFYRLEVKQSTAKGLTNDNRVFTVKQGKDNQFIVEVEETN